MVDPKAPPPRTPQAPNSPQHQQTSGSQQSPLVAPHKNPDPPPPTPKADPNSLKQPDYDHPQQHREDRPQQKDIDEQRKRGAHASGNWRREEGEVIGENPASIDFVGAYPWPNVAEPGENRDDDTILRPPFRDQFDVEETIAEEQRRKSDLDIRAARANAAEYKDDQLEKDYPTNPRSAYRTQAEKDRENRQTA